MTAPLDRRLFLTGMTAMAATAVTAAPRKASPFFSGPGRSIGLQVYMLGDEASKDVDAAFARLAAIGYRDLELPSLMGKSPAELKASADRAGVRFSCIHLGPGGLSGPSALNFETGTRATVDALGTLGITDAVLPLALLPGEFKPGSGEDFRVALARVYRDGGADGWKRTADALNRKAITTTTSNSRRWARPPAGMFCSASSTATWFRLSSTSAGSQRPGAIPQRCCGATRAACAGFTSRTSSG
jgi:hypothetical protein